MEQTSPSYQDQSWILTLVKCDFDLELVKLNFAKQLKNNYMGYQYFSWYGNSKSMFMVNAN